MKAAFIVLMFALGLTSQARACAWESLSPQNIERLLPERFARADTIVIGSVSSLKVGESEQEAQLRVSRTFKGAGTDLRITSSRFMCGYGFKQGEEKVFFVHDGRVNIASVEPASPWLVAALESRLNDGDAPNKALQRTRSKQRASEH